MPLRLDLRAQAALLEAREQLPPAADARQVPQGSIIAEEIHREEEDPACKSFPLSQGRDLCSGVTSRKDLDMFLTRSFMIY